jgi:hypothetical protein
LHPDSFGVSHQEEELGEEGMNPLLAAKLIQRRRKAALKAVEDAETMSLSELKEHLRVRGYSYEAPQTVLVERFRRILARQVHGRACAGSLGHNRRTQLNIAGFGELSKYGDSVVRRIFRKFDVDKDGSLSLFELNSLLHALGMSTVYDIAEYNEFLAESEFACHPENALLAEGGFVAYYEEHGGLVEDMRLLGIGSIDEALSGTIDLVARYFAVDLAAWYFSSLLPAGMIEMALRACENCSKITLLLCAQRNGSTSQALSYETASLTQITTAYTISLAACAFVSHSTYKV